MDPNILSEQPGLSPDSGKGEEGANHLRRLKREATEGAPADGTGKAPAVAATPAWKERRKSLRLRCSGSAEFRAAGSDVRVWGTLTDISLHGCYVEMSATFPVGARVNLVLKSCGISIRVSGTVRTSYPSLGMGICFAAETDREQQRQLNRLLTALAGHSAFSNGGPVPENDMQDTLASADPRAFLDEIAEFFHENQSLSRDEFHEIAKRVRRS